MNLLALFKTISKIVSNPELIAAAKVLWDFIQTLTKEQQEAVLERYFSAEAGGYGNTDRADCPEVPAEALPAVTAVQEELKCCDEQDCDCDDKCDTPE